VGNINNGTWLGLLLRFPFIHDKTSPSRTVLRLRMKEGNVQLTLSHSHLNPVLHRWGSSVLTIIGVLASSSRKARIPGMFAGRTPNRHTLAYGPMNCIMLHRTEKGVRFFVTANGGSEPKVYMMHTYIFI